MTKIKLILAVSFVLTFAAGASVGLLFSRLSRDPRPKPPLTWDMGLNQDQLNELALSRDQQEQIRGINDQNRPLYVQLRKESSALSKQRDHDIDQIMTPELSARYDEVRRQYARKMEELSAGLSRQRDQELAALMPADQRAKYQQITQQYAAKMDELSRRTQNVRVRQIQQITKVLTPDQAKKYEELRKKHERGFRGGWRSRSTASTKPATTQ